MFVTGGPILEKPLKVRGNGGLFLPPAIVKAAGYIPYEHVERRDIKLKQKIGRNVFLSVLGSAGIAAAAWKLLGGLGDLASISGYSFRDVGVRRDQHQRNLELLFGIGATGGALIPAWDHPFRPPPDHGWYPLDASCCDAYRAQVAGNVPVQVVRSHVEMREDDSIILFGSQVSNPEARILFGNPWSANPQFIATPGKLGRDWQAKLRWNLHIPDSHRNHAIVQYGGRWVEPEKVIIEDSKPRKEFPIVKKHFGVRNDNQLRPLELPGVDYLLITSLPRCKAGRQRIITSSASTPLAQWP